MSLVLFPRPVSRTSFAAKLDAWLYRAILLEHSLILILTILSGGLVLLCELQGLAMVMMMLWPVPFLLVLAVQRKLIVKKWNAIEAAERAL